MAEELSLEALREEIDKIDEVIVRLLDRRARSAATRSAASTSSSAHTRRRARSAAEEELRLGSTSRRARR